jgi:hypothetical protein
MQRARIPPVDPAPATIATALVMHAGHIMRTSLLLPQGLKRSSAAHASVIFESDALPHLSRFLLSLVAYFFKREAFSSERFRMVS